MLKDRERWGIIIIYIVRSNSKRKLSCCATIPDYLFHYFTSNHLSLPSGNQPCFVQVLASKRSNDKTSWSLHTAVKDVKIESGVEECASGMEQSANFAAVKDVRIMLRMEECDLGMELRSTNEEECAISMSM